MTKHYFGANLKNKFYKEWNRFTTECGVTIDGRDRVTYDKREISCSNCLRLLIKRRKAIPRTNKFMRILALTL